MSFLKKYKFIILHLCVIAIIILVTVYNIKDLNTITILNDEFGYWSNAALIAHRPWKSLAQHTPYYCFGYSLLLIPLFFIFTSTSIMYRAAIVLNCFMLIGEYILAYKLVAKVSPGVGNTTKIVVSALSVLLCTNMFYSQVAWSECFFSLIVWFLIFCFSKLEQRISIKWMLLASLAMVMLYITHQRAIGLFVPFIVAMAVVYRGKSKRIIRCSFFVIVVLIAYFIQRYISSFQLHLIGDYRVSDLNQLVVNNDTVSKYFDIITSRFLSLLISFCGKMSVMLFSTLGLGLVLLMKWFFSTVRIIKNKDIAPAYYATETFITLSLIVMLLLQSVQMMESDRTDIVVYSRYFDFIFGPVILFTLPYLFKNNRTISIATVGLFTSAVGFYIVDTISWSSSNGMFNVPCSPLVGGIECWFGGISSFVWVALWLCSLFVVVGYSVKKLGKRVIIIAECSLFFFINLGAAHYANEWLNNARSTFVQRTDELVMIVSDYYEDLPIVYLCNSETDLYCTDMKFLQFVLSEEEIIVKDDEKLPKEFDDFILIVNDDYNDYGVLENDNNELVGVAWGYSVYHINEDG